MRVQLLSDDAGERPALPSTGIPTPEHACQPVRTAGRQRGYPGQTTPFTTFTLPLSRGLRIITRVFVTPAITFADLLLSASQAVRWWGANRPRRGEARRAKREKNERKEVIIHPLLLSTTSAPPLHLSSSLSSFNLQLALAPAHPVIIACPISPLRAWWAGLPHSPPAHSPFRPRGVVVSVVVAPPTPFSQPGKTFSLPLKAVNLQHHHPILPIGPFTNSRPPLSTTAIASAPDWQHGLQRTPRA
jgi:hypothetical protein